MINSVNALEFLKPKLLTMDKYNSTTTTKLLPPSSLTQTRTFVTVSDRQHISTIDPLQEKQTQSLLNDEVKHHDRVRVQHLENHTKLQNNKCWNNFRTFYNISASSDISGKERFQIRQKSDDNEIDVVNVEHLTSTTTTSPLDIQNKSAFNLDLINKYPNNKSIFGNNDYNNLKTIDSRKVVETNNNYSKIYCNYKHLNNKQTPPTSMILMSSTISQATTNTFSNRTEDQNHAYRHIESVHNYAKSKSYEGDDDNNTFPNGNHHNSYLDDDEDDDDDDDDDEEENDDDEEYDNDDDMNYEDRLKLKMDELPDDLDADYDDIISKQRYRRFQKYSTLSDGALSTTTDKIMNHKEANNFVNTLKDHKTQSLNVNKKFRESKEEDEIQIDIDVETVESQSSPTIITPVLDTNSLMTNGDGTSAFVKPDHHARRPMNAFLIFCKRHRAIVKERYKNLENRAITKILGDWWASLDTSDKKCFTSLAQQNKDAFFSANPNFKWYKLPAPPLRTLNTRPATAFGHEYHEENETTGLEMINNNARCNSNSNSNFFKFADEAQMGDLSQLMQDKSKNTKQCADLQQVLGETSQFMSAHITGNSETLEENRLKRRFYNENSFSSNSSEEDGVESKKKNVRSCKGKRYQELINSGQIATATKKSKSSTRAVNGDDGRDNSEINTKQNFSIVNGLISNQSYNNGCEKGSACESENMLSYDLNGFDLEEKIKELPALNLDDYLLRKRCTKKKKKFSSNGKKRGQRSNTNNNSSDNITNSNLNDNLSVRTLPDSAVVASLSNESLEQQPQQPKQQQHNATAVGSQKRKARKESITRRDVSAIEQEAASLLPLTINGCCYFQEAPTAAKYIKTSEKDIEAKYLTPQLPDITSTIIPSTQNSSSSISIDVLCNNNNNNINNNNNNNNIRNILNDNILSSSTSDLLILAEVAANRTELKH